MKKNFSNGENYDIKTDLINSSADIDDDSYFDDRIEAVFDEIVQLRAEQNQLNSQGQASSRNGSDFSLHEEIIRLKDELNRNKSSQDLRSEISMLKSDLTRESYLLEEIRKVNDRLDGLKAGDTKKSKNSDKIKSTDSFVNDKLMDNTVETNFKNNIIENTDSIDESPNAVLNSQSVLEFEEVKKSIAEVKELLTKNSYNHINSRPYTAYDDIYGILVSEISALREDILSKSGAEPSDTNNLLQKLDGIFDETIRLKTLVEKSDDEIRSEIKVKHIDGEMKDDVADLSAQIMTLREEIKASKIMEQDEVLKEIEALRKDISDVKSLRTYVVNSESNEVQPTYSEANLMLSEIVSLRQEIEAYKDELTQNAGDKTTGIAYDDVSEIKALFEDMKEFISRRPALAISDEGNADNDVTVSGLTVVLDEIYSLKKELGTLKDEINNAKSGVEFIQPQNINVDNSDIKAELAKMRSTINAINDEPNLTVLREVLELRDEFQAVKEKLANKDILINAERGEVAGTIVTGNNTEFIAELKNLNEKVSALGGIIGGGKNADNDSFILPELTAQFESLRDNVAALGGLVNDMSAADTQIMDEIKTLRDQVFAINMAKVDDGDTSKYENYNDIILDEIFTLRDEFEGFRKEAKNGENKQELLNRLGQMDNSIKSINSDKMTKEMCDAFKTEIDSLKAEIADRRTADELTLNFMNEMALLIERQNELIAVGETQPKSRMEKLRDEIASTIVTQDIPSKRDIEDLSRAIDTLKTNLASVTDQIETAPAQKADSTVQKADSSKPKDNSKKKKANDSAKT